MICPIDQSPLEMSERSGIEIDYRDAPRSSSPPKRKENWLGELFG
jgi:Zn-finger nucleic acid-binding protein